MWLLQVVDDELHQKVVMVQRPVHFSDVSVEPFTPIVILKKELHKVDMPSVSILMSCMEANLFFRRARQIKNLRIINKFYLANDKVIFIF